MNPPGSFRRGAADGQPVNFYRRDADAHRDRLSVLAAGANTLVQLQIVANHGDPGENIRAVTDQSRAFYRSGDLPSSIM